MVFPDRANIEFKTKIFILFLCLLSNLVFTSQISGQNGNKISLSSDSSKVLLLFSYGYGLPAYQKMTPNFITAMKNYGISPNNLFFEFLDLQRDKGKITQAQLREEILKRYENRGIDIIVTFHEPALHFLLDNCRGIFTNVPVVSVLAPEKINIKKDELTNPVFLLPMSPDFEGTLNIALGFFPATKEVIYVTGKGDEDISIKQEAMKVFSKWENKINFVYTDSLTIEETEKLTSSRSPGSIIIYSSYFSDRTGRSFHPLDIWFKLGKTASVPIFGLYDVMLGTGMIGGALISFEEEGKQAANLAFEIISKKATLHNGVTIQQNKRLPGFDWPQLKKWGLENAQLPSDSRVLNYEPTFWEKYGIYLIAIIVFITLQWFLISLLFVQKRQKESALNKLFISEAKYRQLFESNVDGISIFFINPDQTVSNFVELNESAARMVGYTREEMQNLSVADLEEPIPENALMERSNALKTNGVYGFETRIKHKNGNLIDVEIKVIAISFNNRMALMNIVRDITDRKKAELEIKKHKEHLEEMVKERTAELIVEIKKKEAAERLLKTALVKEKELNELKTRFISTATHEFKTPLTSIMTSAELLQRFDSTWTSEKKSEYLTRMIGSVIKMTKMIDDVLSVSKAETVKNSYEFCETDIFELSEKIVFESRLALSGDANISHSFNGEPKVFMVDPGQIELILRNLLSNAVKYSPSGGTVDLAVSCSENGISIKVSDQGIGIPASDIPKLFEPFHRASNVASFKGSGLGLSIVKHAVEIHKGNIEVESSVDIGTTFTIFLPVSIGKAENKS